MGIQPFPPLYCTLQTDRVAMCGMGEYSQEFPGNGQRFWQKQNSLWRILLNIKNIENILKTWV